MGTEIQLAVAGDVLATRRLGAVERSQNNQIYQSVREADVSIANLEMLLHDYEGYPASNSVAHFSGTYLRAPPWVADELGDIGFDMFAAASNHTGDFSHGGMLNTMGELENRNIPYAGLGENLSDARSPTYVDTRGGRVALVAAASTITPGTEAGPQRPDIIGRPGLSPLRLESRYVVTEDQIDQLRQISKQLGLEDIKQQRKQADLPSSYSEDSQENLLNLLQVSQGHGGALIFEEGERPHVYQRPRSEDITQICTQIQEANRQADWVVVSLHCHEGENGAYNDRTVAPFIESFAHECVKSGADVFMGHGPHTLRGIEIYENSPIFYSLGDFICQLQYIPKLPTEVYNRYDLEEDQQMPSAVHELMLTSAEYWETVLPICKFENGEFSHVELKPAELGFGEGFPYNGEPVVADGDLATSILSRTASLSEEYGTEIDVRDGVGIITA